MGRRTVLRVKAWGPKVKYSNGKIAFTFIEPVLDMGMPIGYMNTAHARAIEPEPFINPRRGELRVMQEETGALEDEVAQMEAQLAEMRGMRGQLM